MGAQAWGRYAYTLNNPVKYVDPSGHYVCENLDCELPTKPITPNWIPKPNDDTNAGGYQGEPGEILGNSDDGSEDCPYGWVSALMTPDGSCGHIKINENAIVDPFAWDHIVVQIGGGVVLMVIGGVLIQVGLDVCTTGVGCLAAAPVIIAGIAAIPAGGSFIYGGLKATKHYLDEIFEVVP